MLEGKRRRMPLSAREARNGDQSVLREPPSPCTAAYSTICNHGGAPSAEGGPRLGNGGDGRASLTGLGTVLPRLLRSPRARVGALVL